MAQEVQHIAEADAEKGLLEAQALLGNINRKLVKQTVMTSVYGVTNVGARDQIKVKHSVCAPHSTSIWLYHVFAFVPGLCYWHAQLGKSVLLLSPLAAELLQSNSNEVCSLSVSMDMESKLHGNPREVVLFFRSARVWRHTFEPPGLLVQARLKERGWNANDDLTFKVASYAAGVSAILHARIRRHVHHACGPGLTSAWPWKSSLVSHSSQTAMALLGQLSGSTVPCPLAPAPMHGTDTALARRQPCRVCQPSSARPLRS